MKNVYKELAKIQAQRKTLEAQEAELKLAIIEDMESLSETSTVTTYGKATISHRTSYEYTEAVQKLSEKLKLAKLKEEQKGIATPKQSKYLIFTLPKE
jgi:hypothetical protein